MNEKIIYTKRIAYELRKLGFQIVRVEPNPNKPQFDCYVFDATDDFRKAFDTVVSK